MFITIHENHIHNVQTLKIFQAEDTLGNGFAGFPELNHNYQSASGVQYSSALVRSLLVWIEIHGKGKLRENLQVIGILFTIFAIAFQHRTAPAYDEK